jgi:hypothetical protein
MHTADLPRHVKQCGGWGCAKRAAPPQLSTAGAAGAAPPPPLPAGAAARSLPRAGPASLES